MKRPKIDGILASPLGPMGFIEGLRELDPEIAEYTLNRSITLREEALFERYGLKRPEILPQVVRKLIQEMATEFGMICFTDRTKIRTPGQPNKWLGQDGITLLQRIQEFQKRNPEMSLACVIDNIRRTYKYSQTKKRLRVIYYEIVKNPDSAYNLIRDYEKDRKPLSPTRMAKLMDFWHK